jgi:hypothetical protein
MITIAKNIATANAVIAHVFSILLFITMVEELLCNASGFFLPPAPPRDALLSSELLTASHCELRDA